jgi:hypothetical protein
MNVDTSEFQAITGRLAAVEGAVANLAAEVEHRFEVEAILAEARAGGPRPARRDRHGLHAVGGGKRP